MPDIQVSQLREGDTIRESHSRTITVRRIDPGCEKGRMIHVNESMCYDPAAIVTVK